MSVIVPLGNSNNHTKCFLPTVVVFPHAGGSPRFYAHWVATLPHHQLWGITYPGRDARLSEVMPISLQALALECAAHLDLLLDRTKPVILFGHSMGAFVAWETAQCLEKMTQSRLIKTVVSGQNAPYYSSDRYLHKQDDAALIADMNRQNPAHKALWDIPELRQFFLPTVREDYRILETYQPTAGTVADLTVIYGEDDKEIDRTTLHLWRKASRGCYRTKCMPEGHFYLKAPNTSLPHYLGELLTC